MEQKKRREKHREREKKSKRYLSYAVVYEMVEIFVCFYHSRCCCLFQCLFCSVQCEYIVHCIRWLELFCSYRSSHIYIVRNQICRLRSDLNTNYLCGTIGYRTPCFFFLSSIHRPFTIFFLSLFCIWCFCLFF